MSTVFCLWQNGVRKLKLMSTAVLKPGQHSPTDPPAARSTVLYCCVVQGAVTFLFSDETKRKGLHTAKNKCCPLGKRIMIILQLTDVSERHKLKISGLLLWEHSCAFSSVEWHEAFEEESGQCSGCFELWNSVVFSPDVLFLGYFSKCSLILKLELHPSVNSVTSWALDYSQFYWRELLCILWIYLRSDPVNSGVKLTLRISVPIWTPFTNLPLKGRLLPGKQIWAGAFNSTLWWHTSITFTFAIKVLRVIIHI